MARGYLFEVSKDKDKVYCVDSNYFADKLGTLGVESIKDDKSGDHTKDLILSDLTKTVGELIATLLLEVVTMRKIVSSYRKFEGIR